MNRIFGIIFCLFMVCIVHGQQAIIDKVIANIGSEFVLLSELEEQRALAASQQQGTLPPEARCMIMENILSGKLLVNQAKIDSVEVSDVEVESQLAARIDQILAYMNNDVTQFEAYYGQSINQVKDEFRTDLKNQLLAERMRGQITADVSVTPAEVKAFFARIPKDSLPYFNAEVEVSELVYAPKPSETAKETAKKKLEELRSRVVDGKEDFAVLAEKYSDDFGSARIGGDLGWSKRGKFVPEFEAAAYNLDPNEISPITESQFGYHLIQLLERRGNSIHTRHILIKPEVSDKDLDKAMALLDSVRNVMTTDSVKFAIMVKKYGDEQEQSYNNDGRVTNPATGNTFFEIADLEPDVFFSVDTLTIGDISRAYSFRSQSGETMYRMVKLESRTSPHKADLSKDYSKIRAAAIEEKSGKFLTNWLIDKVEQTFIKIDPAYKTCPNLQPWLVEAKP